MKKTLRIVGLGLAAVLLSVGMTACLGGDDDEDGEDLWEFFNGGREEGDPEKETFSKEDLKECRNELIWAAAESHFYGGDIYKIAENCNETIKRYA